MKNSLKLSTVMTMGALAMTGLHSVAHAYFNPYIGVGTELKSTGFKSGFGKGLFKTAHPFGKVYVGLEITPNFDLEFSVERSLSKKKSPAEGHDTKAKFFAIGTDAVYKIPTCCDNIKVLAGIGAKQLRVQLNSKGIQNFSVDKNKLVLRALGGVQYAYSDHVSSKVTLSYEHTSRIKDVSDSANVKLRNSVAIATGLTFQI